ncbi:glycoside hydrolase family 3 protein [Paenibacillus sp. TRM 82003]|nr:glycoside hydrolase family 3 protein [Paenibacillus sp. TRM 82003]
MNTMDALRRKLGLLTMCGFDGTEPNEAITDLIENEGVGGIVYFRRNLVSPEQTARMTAALQASAAKVGAPPLLVSIDQEGGMVARLDRGVALPPGNMALGATGDPAAAREAARVTAAELTSLGINMNFAPCLDVNNNLANPVIGVRSFGADAERVAAFGVEAVRGYAEGGVIAVAKHFPGHGDTAVDSHRDLPVVPHGKARLSRIELAPFRAAVAAGVPCLMTAHVVFPAVEPSGLPATLSPAVLTGLLREELGYDGVIVTDCLEMKAIADRYGIARGAVMAIKGGADLVLISHTYAAQKEALAALARAVEDGDIPMRRIDDAVERILRLKAQAGAPRPSPEAAGAAERIEAATRLSERTVTVVRNRGAFPIDPSVTTLVITAEVRVGSEVDEVIEQATLADALRAAGAKAEEVRIGVDPSEAESAEAMRRAASSEQCVIASYDAAFHPTQEELIQRLLHEAGGSVVVAAVRSPYDLARFPEAAGAVATYENRPLAMASLVRLLLGELDASGRLPVPLDFRAPDDYSVE